MLSQNILSWNGKITPLNLIIVVFEGKQQGGNKDSFPNSRCCKILFVAEDMAIWN